MSKSIPIAKPLTDGDELAMVAAVLESGWLTQGPKTTEFEAEFAKFAGARHAVAVTSCTAGLYVALAVADIGPGDEVIVPSFTWVATANVVAALGATPVLVDVSLDDYNICPESAAAAVTDRTVAVLPVHLFGHAADTDAIRAVIPADTLIVEDAACAFGSRMSDGSPIGSSSSSAVYSLHPRKAITTGEGGMITTDDDDLADRLQTYRNHGATVSEETRHHGPAPWRLPSFPALGLNYRITDLQSAVGLAQMRKADGILAHRRELVKVYDELIASHSDLVLPTRNDLTYEGFQSYVVRVTGDDAEERRNRVLEGLHVDGVGARPGTHSVAHLDLYMEQQPAAADRCPNSRTLAATTMALPLHQEVSYDDARWIFDRVNQHLAHAPASAVSA